MTTYSAEVRVDDFGCAADGVTDDTQCFNDAIEYVTANGTRAGAVALTQGKTYFIGTITGYMQTAWDDGTAPSSDTCGGVPCTNLAPETPGYLGYAIRIPSNQSSPLTIYGNGATIVSSFTVAAAEQAAYSMSAPYFAVFGSDTGDRFVEPFRCQHQPGIYCRGDAERGLLAVGPSDDERGRDDGAGWGSSQYESFRDTFIDGGDGGNRLSAAGGARGLRIRA